MSLRNRLKDWVNKAKFMGLVLVIFAFGSLVGSDRVTASPVEPATGGPEGCALTIVSVQGNVAAFSVTAVGTTAVRIDPVNNWGAIGRDDSNANVNVTFTPAVPTGSDPVIITATEVDPAQSGNFGIFAIDDESGFGIKIALTTSCTPTTGCTVTPGFWKNVRQHPWPIANLTLGTVNYSQQQLLNIMNTAVKGNGLVSLSHHLIAAKLNAAAGANVPSGVATAISEADALIGGLVVPPVGTGSLPPRDASSLISTLDAYNNGLAPGGPAHCDDNDDK